MFKLILKKKKEKKILKIISFLLTYIEGTGRKRRKMGRKKRGIGRSAAWVGTWMGCPMERMGRCHSSSRISATRVAHATSHPGTRATGRNDASKWLGCAVSRFERNLDQVSILPRPYCSRCPYLLVWQHHHLLARLSVKYVTSKNVSIKLIHSKKNIILIHIHIFTWKESHWTLNTGV